MLMLRNIVVINAKYYNWKYFSICFGAIKPGEPPLL